MRGETPVEMAAPPCRYQLFVGMDIAALTVTVAWQDAVSHHPPPAVSKPRTFEQTPNGFSQLDHALRALGVAPAQTLVVMEATGA
jgi:transposase